MNIFQCKTVYVFTSTNVRNVCIFKFVAFVWIYVLNDGSLCDFTWIYFISASN